MSPQPHRATLSLDAYVEGVRAGDRAVLSRAITLIESRKPEHREVAEPLLQALLPDTGNARRVGITGVPGVGKSTFIEALGTRLTTRGHRLAVLAVDPSSARTGGSILGDKTRMARLAGDPDAYIRPSPSAGALGGVARTTRETMLLCEAAGFDVVLVETVGVGQSETLVAEMVDIFLALMLPGAGDELQGIKKGIVELADLIAINKADGDNALRAEQAVVHYRRALDIIEPKTATWKPPVLAISSVTGAGLDELWRAVEQHGEALGATGEHAANRRAQQVRWFWSLIETRLFERFRRHPAAMRLLPQLEADVAAGTLTPPLAAERALSAFGAGRSEAGSGAADHV
jgi:LAO/AO transport system kinase